MIGTSLGSYRILQPLGAGGMGEVYLAEDTRLGRRVAVKVLPAALTADAASVARLEQEARLLAQLEHPNVATVFGLEVAPVIGGGEPIRHLVMQLAEGEPLSARIARGALPADEALEIARQVAAGLGAAHDKGIIHRDLKPANVMVADGPGGRPVVKVLDFGLAKALAGEAHAADRDLTTSPTVAAATAAGVILGTAAYMSPEQARGKQADRRTDVWAFACLLYEMLAGRPAFGGDTVSDIIAAILTREPDWAALPEDVPAETIRALRRCLQRDVERRPYDVRDVLMLMEPGSVAPAADDTPRAAGIPWPAVAAFVLLAAAGSYAIARLGSTPSAEIAAASVAPNHATQLTYQAGAEAFPSISADGEWIVYASRADGDWDVYLQAVGGDNAINLTEDSPADDFMPALSPDGRQIVFRSERGDGGIYVMGRTGESVRRLGESGYNPAWAPDGSHVVVASEMITDSPYARESVSQLSILEVASGAVSGVVTADAVQPSFSPDGKWLVYWGVLAQSGQRDLWVVDVEGGEPVALTSDVPTEWTPVFTPDGAAVVFSSDRGGALGLWRLELDPASKKPLGEPQLMIPSTSQWLAYPAFAAQTGQLLYAAMGSDQQVNRILLDDAARRVVEGPTPLTSGSRRGSSPDISPDGEWLAYATGQGQQEDLYLQRIDGSLTRRLTNDAFKDRSPRFSPDGRTLAFYAARGAQYGLWAIDVDGSNLRQLTSGLEGAYQKAAWAPDGRRIVTSRTDDGNAQGIVVLTLTDDGVQDSAVAVEAPEDTYLSATDWSSDGRYLVADVASAAGRISGSMVVDAQTGAARRISDFGGNAIFLADSRHVAFTTTAAEIWITDTGTGESWIALSVRPNTLVDYISALRDGLGVLFTVRRQEDDLWLAEWR